MKKIIMTAIALFLLLGLYAFDYSPKREDICKLLFESKYDKAINLVFLGDGFTAADIKNGIYDRAVNEFVNSFFYVAPFAQYKYYFNIYIVYCVSRESGADDAPGRDTKDTLFNATFGGSGIDRLLIIQDFAKADQYSRYASDNPHSVIILVNDARYGGSGGYYSVASLSSSVFTLIMHELGHSFGDLEDEYVDERISSNYPLNPASLTANVDIVGDVKKIKWHYFVGLSGYEKVGAYEGAYYRSKGVWRSQENCCMRALGYTFCHACREILTKKICLLTGIQYKLDEFINMNPIVKNDRELLIYDPVNSRNEKIIPYASREEKDNSNEIKNEKKNNLDGFLIIYSYKDGYYLNKGDDVWEERLNGGGIYLYKQYDRDQYYFYINDASRNRYIALPIDHSDLYMWNGNEWSLIGNVQRMK